MPCCRQLNAGSSLDLFHQFQFLLCQLRQMADEQDQLPVFFIPTAPSRHPGEPDAIADDIEDLTVGQLLSSAGTHVRGGWEHVAPHLGVPAAVVSMAYRAMIGEMIATFGHRKFGGCKGIFQPPYGGGCSQVPG